MNKYFFKTYFIVVSFLTVFITTVQALSFEHWYVPTENSSQILVIENPQDHPEDLWISGPIDLNSEQPYEYFFRIPPKNEIKVPQELVGKFPWLHLKSNSTLIRVRLFDSYIQKDYANSYTGLLYSQSLLLLNLSGINQSLQVTSPSGNISVALMGFEKRELDIGVGPVEVTASMPIKVFAKSKTSLSNLDINKKPISLNTVAGTYFLMADVSHSQSFVVRIEDPKQIEQARAQIKDPGAPLPRNLSAQVTYKNQNHNRNFASPNKTTWSWHVEKVYRFGDIGSTFCNGSPEMIEELLLPFMEGSSGTICFWNFRIFKELTAEEVSSP